MKRKLITAIVRPFLIDKIVVALENLEKFSGVIIAAAEGFGHRFKTKSGFK